MTRMHQSKDIKSSSGFPGAFPTAAGMGRREAVEDAAEGTKIRRDEILIDSPPFPRVTGFLIPSF